MPSLCFEEIMRCNLLGRFSLVVVAIAWAFKQVIERLYHKFIIVFFE